MTRRIAVTLLVLIAVLLLATPVLAYLYRAQVSITEGNGTDYDMLGVVWSQNNDYLADNGYMDTDALDTRVQNLGGTNYPWLVTETTTLTASPVDGNSQTNLYFVTGETPATDMDIIAGDGGYVTMTDAAALELDDNFKTEFSAYIGEAHDLIHKTLAYEVTDDGAGSVAASILTNSDTLPTGFTDSGGTWNNEANAYDDNPVTAATENVGAAAWGNYLELTHAALDIDGVRVYATIQNYNAGKLIDVDVFDGSWHDVYQGSYASATWLTYPAVYTGVTNMRIRFYNDDGGVARVASLYEMHYTSETAARTATATGVSDGDSDVTVEADSDVFDFLVDNGDVLHFNGGATNAVDCGALHNNSAKLWVFMRFELDDTFNDSSPTRQELFTKAVGGGDYVLASLRNDSGQIGFLQQLGGITGCALYSTTTEWDAGQIYEVLFSISDTGGGVQRLLVDGLLEASGTTAAKNLPNGGNFIIGYNAHDSSMIIHDVVVGTDDLLVAEETAMFAGDFPADAVNLWHLDEGAGGTAYDLGTGGNDGTIGAGCSWETDQRYVDYYIDVDGESWGVNLDGTSVPDESSDWYLYPDPYWEYYEHTVSGTLVVNYDPEDIVQGLVYDTGTVTVTNGDETVEGAGTTWTDSMAGGVFISADGAYYVIDSITDSDTLELATAYGGGTLGGQDYDMYGRLPDLEGAAQDGAITWGSNPAGISVSVGSMVSSGQGVVGEEEETETSDILPPAGTTNWDEAPDVTGALLTNPMRPIVVAASDNTSLSERQVWVYGGLVFLLLVVAGVSRIVRGHHLITGIAGAAVIIALAVMTIWPYWSLVFVALAVIGGLVAERSPSL